MSFLTLKQKLQQAPILAYPDVTKPYRLYCNASNIGIGAVLAQLDAEGRECITQYIFHRFGPTQRNWPFLECKILKCLCYTTIIWIIIWYLYGSKFVIFTDHKPLKFLFESRHLRNSKTQRWALLLLEYNVDIEYITGKLNL